MKSTIAQMPNVTSNFMKHLFILIITTAILTSPAKGQKLDSIKYKHGYLYYHEYGTGEPVILLSGGPGGSYQQEEEVAVELSKSFKAILLEQRGTGRSIPTPFDSTTINLQSALSDLNLLLEHFKLKQAIIFGHSWGAMLAMSFAAAYPSKVKSLVLLAPGPYKDWQNNSQSIRMVFKSRMGLQEQVLFDSLTKKWDEGTATAADSLERRKLISQAQVFNKSFSDSVTARIKLPSNAKMQGLMFKDLIKSYDLTSSLVNYKGNIDIICCSQDYVVNNSYEIKLLMPKAQLHWLAECGHWPQFEQPKTFYATLFAILTRK